MASLFNNGYLRLYTGPKPADASTAITTQTLIVEHRFASQAFGTASNGTVTASAIANSAATATGTVSWFRCFASDGTTVLMDGTVAAAGAADLKVDAVDLGTGVTNRINSFTITQVM